MRHAPCSKLRGISEKQEGIRYWNFLQISAMSVSRLKHAGHGCEMASDNYHAYALQQYHSSIPSPLPITSDSSALITPPQSPHTRLFSLCTADFYCPIVMCGLTLSKTATLKVTVSSFVGIRLLYVLRRLQCVAVCIISVMPWVHVK